MNAALDTLKERLTHPPVLIISSFENLFQVDTDASPVTVGAVLSQKKVDGKMYLVDLASRTMNSAERNHPICKNEVLAVTFTLKRFIVYLLSSQPFELFTNHKALQYTLKKKGNNGIMARWLDFLSEYSFRISYVSDASN